MDLFLARDSDLHKKIFGPSNRKQFQARCVWRDILGMRMEDVETVRKIGTKEGVLSFDDEFATNSNWRNNAQSGSMIAVECI